MFSSMRSKSGLTKAKQPDRTAERPTIQLAIDTTTGVPVKGREANAHHEFTFLVELADGGSQSIVNSPQVNELAPLDISQFFGVDVRPSTALR